MPVAGIQTTEAMMRDYMTAMEWKRARHSSAWLVAYVDALNHRRPVCLIKPEFQRQDKLFGVTRACGDLRIVKIG
jgi:hypothetical protein